ncbi:hypothetical protein GJ744_007462 [Endocarpon pusillum]|uniref:Uncharacterized protein n=1 Tax=Endocarpon pusillum TaxID=364733 RepID=A0A8H7AMS4_9EURO|nr:hypothetical protein GJ744_007462 [Endocarpon pusillum]
MMILKWMTRICSSHFNCDASVEDGGGEKFPELDIEEREVKRDEVRSKPARELLRQQTETSQMVLFIGWD